MPPPMIRQVPTRTRARIAIPPNAATPRRPAPMSIRTAAKDDAPDPTRPSRRAAMPPPTIPAGADKDAGKDRNPVECRDADVDRRRRRSGLPEGRCARRRPARARRRDPAGHPRRPVRRAKAAAAVRRRWRCAAPAAARPALVPGDLTASGGAGTGAAIPVPQPRPSPAATATRPVAAAVAASLPPVVSPRAVSGAFVPDEVLVTIDGGTADVQDIAAGFGLQIRSQRLSALLGVTIVRYGIPDGRPVGTVLAQLAADAAGIGARAQPRLRPAAGRSDRELCVQAHFARFR